MIDISNLTGKSTPDPDRWLFFALPQFEDLPPEHQDQLLFLDTASSEMVFETINNLNILCDDDGWGNKPFSGGCYASVEHFEMWRNEDKLKKWLYHRGVTFKTNVFVLKTFGSKDDPVLLTTWKMIVKYADTFFSGENTLFFDEKISWCLHYHHDGKLDFAKGRNFKDVRPLRF